MVVVIESIDVTAYLKLKITIRLKEPVLISALASILKDILKEELASPSVEAGEGWIELYERGTYSITIWKDEIEVWCIHEVLPKMLNVITKALKRLTVLNTTRTT